MKIEFKHLSYPKSSYEYQMAHLRHQSVLEDIGDHILTTIVDKQDPRTEMNKYYHQHPKLNTYFTDYQYKMVVQAYITQYNNMFNTQY